MQSVFFKYEWRYLLALAEDKRFGKKHSLVDRGLGGGSVAPRHVPIPPPRLTHTAATSWMFHLSTGGGSAATASFAFCNHSSNRKQKANLLLCFPTLIWVGWWICAVFRVLSLCNRELVKCDPKKPLVKSFGTRCAFLNDWQKGTMLIGRCRIPSRREPCRPESGQSIIDTRVWRKPKHD